LQADPDRVLNVGKRLFFGGALTDTARNGGTLDDPNAVFITINRNYKSHKITST
jgi:hypothetical protein